MNDEKSIDVSPEPRSAISEMFVSLRKTLHGFNTLRAAHDNAFAVCQRWCTEFGIVGYGSLTELAVYEDEVCFKGVDTWPRGGYGEIEVLVPALAFDDFDAAVAHEKERREARRLYLLAKAKEEQEAKSFASRANLLKLAEQMGAVVHFPDYVPGSCVPGTEVR